MEARRGPGRLDVVGEHLHERLVVGGERDGVLDARDRVADPQLDRAEPRVEADVPPDVRVVGDAAGALELADQLRELLVALEPRGTPERGKAEKTICREERARRLAAPERRAGRERQELRQVDQEPVRDVDRLVGVVDRRVHVHAEDQLAPCDVLHLVDELAVPVLGRDPLPLEEAEGVRSRRGEAAALRRGRCSAT